MKRSEAGFSFVELLTAMGILSVLAAVALPQLNSYKDSGILARVQGDLRHIATAEEAYFLDNETFTSCTNSDCVSKLAGITALSRGVQIEMISTGTEFTGTATHERLSVTCQWDSSQEGFLGCS